MHGHSSEPLTPNVVNAWADIRTTEHFVRKEEDGEMAARRIQIRVAGRKQGGRG